MSLECCCLGMAIFPIKQLPLWILPRRVLLHNLHVSQHYKCHMLPTTPAVIYHQWHFKLNRMLKCHNLISKSLFISIQPQLYHGKGGPKHQSNYKCNFVKEVKQEIPIKTVKGYGVIKGVQRAFLDKKIKLHQTEEQWKRSSKRIIADIKETRTKMKVKMEKIIERENVFTVPNLLCLSRIAMSPYLGYLILEQDFHWALGVLTVAGITDLLDGWIARTFKNQSSKLGSFLDPMADKILIATMFLTLTYAEIIPVPLTSLIITRDVILVIAGFVIRYKSLPPPRTLSRYFDVTHATAQLAPTFISKVNTMVQLLTVACTLAAPVFDYLDHPVILGLWYVTAVTTLASAGSYLLSKNTFRFLKKPM